MRNPVSLSIAFSTAVITTAFALSGCSPNNHRIGADAPASQDGIVNGIDGVAADVAKGGIAESVVFLDVAVDDTSNSFCTGTLISNDLVLTAAHCLPEGTPIDGIKVHLQMLSIKKSQALTLEADAFKIHPGYQREGDEPGEIHNADDLAIIHLSTPVPEGTRTATLPTASTVISSTLLSIGYGVANDRHGVDFVNTGIGALRHTSFRASDSQPLNKDTAGMIVLSSAKSSTCQGDSGGPLMLTSDSKSTNQVVGVAESVSPGYKDQQLRDYRAAQSSERPDAALDDFFKKYPAATECTAGNDNFVDVRVQLDWIHVAMNELKKPSTQNQPEQSTAGRAQPSELDPPPYIPSPERESARPKL